MEKITDTTNTNKYLFSHRKDLNHDLGIIIRNIRLSKNITREELAEMLVTSTSYISQIESGKNGVSLIKFIAICNALEISPQKIIEDYVYTETNSILDNKEFYEYLQNEKDLSKNLINYIKYKRD